MARLNHAKHAHRGRPTESAFSRQPSGWHTPAKAAGPARSLSSEAKAAWAAQHGVLLSARAR